MIPKILRPQDLEYTFAVIMPDMEQPWEIMNHCEKWMKVLKEAIFQISPQVPIQKLDFLKERIEDQFRSFSEPEFGENGKFISKRKIKIVPEDGDIGDLNIEVDEEQAMYDELKKEVELAEGTLVTNLFIPTAVICSKIDLIQHGEKSVSETLEKYIDYI